VLDACKPNVPPLLREQVEIVTQLCVAASSSDPSAAGPRTAIYLSSYCYISVLILLYICPHTTIYLFSYYYYCTSVRIPPPALTPLPQVLILLYICPHTTSYCYISVLVLLCICSHAAIYLSAYYYSSVLILILLYICPHTASSADPSAASPHTAIYLSSYYYISVLILLYICSHTTIYLSSYCCISVRIPPPALTLCRRSSYFYTSALILLYICPHTATCPHTAIYLSAYYNICVLMPPTSLYISGAAHAGGGLGVHAQDLAGSRDNSYSLAGWVEEEEDAEHATSSEKSAANKRRPDVHLHPSNTPAPPPAAAAAAGGANSSLLVGKSLSSSPLGALLEGARSLFLGRKTAVLLPSGVLVSGGKLPANAAPEEGMYIYICIYVYIDR
jgi:hypothetical protein